MEAAVRRGLLSVRDEKGSYRIPVGRRGRKCLIVLDKKEGEYIRSLELDLFTGFVYYCVDNLTSGGLSYYYDMSSKKVGHYFIHRYLRLAIVRGVEVTPVERAVFEMIPCENWVEEMEKLPGWKEAIEHRVDRLLLPWKEPVQIRILQTEHASAAAAEGGCETDLLSSGTFGPEDPGRAGSASGEGTITFSRFPEAYPSQARKYVFQFVKNGEGYALRHLDENIGGEFFGENEEYELYLTEAEFAWIRETVRALFLKESRTDWEKEGQAGTLALAALEPFEEMLSDGAGMVTKETEVRFAGMDYIETGSAETGGKKSADTLFNLLRGLLRREIELL